MDRATALSAAGQPALAAERLNQLIRRREAGRYALPGAELTAMPDVFRATYDVMLAPAYEARARVYEQLRQYARAVADLDTFILRYSQQPGLTTAYCRRGQLRADFLHDPDGACADLKECFRRGAQPSGPAGWRGCPQERWQRERNRIAASYADHNRTYRAGVLAQGRAWGVEGGIQASGRASEQGEWFFNHGPSVGLEVLGAPLTVAPKLSYELEFVLIGGRLDLTGYVPLTGPERGVDLRLVPQAGISLVAIANVFYGYALPLSDTQLDVLGRHRISVYINFLKATKFGG